MMTALIVPGPLEEMFTTLTISTRPKALIVWAKSCRTVARLSEIEALDHRADAVCTH
jgi:hypothetical protein